MIYKTLVPDPQKNLIIKTIQENRSNGITRIKFIIGNEKFHQENIHNNFPKWVSDTKIKKLSFMSHDGSYMVFLKTSDNETFYNINNFLQQKASDDELMYLDGDENGDQDAKAALKWLKKIC